MRPLGSVEAEVERRIHALASRTEERIARAVAVQLSTWMDHRRRRKPSPRMLVFVCPRVTKQHWKPEERVLLKSLEKRLPVAGASYVLSAFDESVFAVGWI